MLNRIYQNFVNQTLERGTSMGNTHCAITSTHSTTEECRVLWFGTLASLLKGK